MAAKRKSRKGKTANFGGKKAAPFAKGGGRKSSHSNTAKGKPRKKVTSSTPKFGSPAWRAKYAKKGKGKRK